MDDAGGHRGGLAGMDRPRAGFLLARGEVGPQAEQVIRGADEVSTPGLRDPQVSEVLAASASGSSASSASIWAETATASVPEWVSA